MPPAFTRGLTKNLLNSATFCPFRSWAGCPLSVHSLYYGVRFGAECRMSAAVDFTPIFTLTLTLSHQGRGD